MDHDDDDTPTTSTVISGRRVADFLDRIWEVARRVRSCQADLLDELQRHDSSRRADVITASTIRVRTANFHAAQTELSGLLEAGKILDLPAATLAIATGTDRDAFWAEFDAWRES